MVTQYGASNTNRHSHCDVARDAESGIVDLKSIK